MQKKNKIASLYEWIFNEICNQKKVFQKNILGTGLALEKNKQNIENV